MGCSLYSLFPEIPENDRNQIKDNRQKLMLLLEKPPVKTK